MPYILDRNTNMRCSYFARHLRGNSGDKILKRNNQCIVGYNPQTAAVVMLTVRPRIISRRTTAIVLVPDAMTYGIQLLIVWLNSIQESKKMMKHEASVPSTEMISWVCSQCSCRHRWLSQSCSARHQWRRRWKQVRSMHQIHSNAQIKLPPLAFYPRHHCFNQQGRRTESWGRVTRAN